MALGPFIFLFSSFYLLEEGGSRKEKKTEQSPQNTTGNGTCQSSFLVKSSGLFCGVLSCVRLEGALSAVMRWCRKVLKVCAWMEESLLGSLYLRALWIHAKGGQSPPGGFAFWEWRCQWEC